MPQPDFVPIVSSERVRVSERLPVPESWIANRPGDIATVRQPTGKKMGSPGPDQGYGLKLAKQYLDRLQLSPNEHAADAVAGCLAVALKRSSLFGRAPVIYDYEFAYALWGFLEDAPADLIAARGHLFEAASHDYEDQRAIADAIPESTLRMTPQEVKSQLGNWKQLILI